ncbi:MAG: hypothetical protein ACTS73_02875 [Arsenophonus sp. NEOnobi-MAG3]
MKKLPYRYLTKLDISCEIPCMNSFIMVPGIQTANKPQLLRLRSKPYCDKMLKRYLIDGRHHHALSYIMVTCHSEAYRLLLAILRLKCIRSEIAAAMEYAFNSLLCLI